MEGQAGAKKTVNPADVALRGAAVKVNDLIGVVRAVDAVPGSMKRKYMNLREGLHHIITAACVEHMRVLRDGAREEGD